MTPTAALELSRPALEERLLARARAEGPLLLTGPPGAGKTTLLRALGRALVKEGWEVVSLDLMGAASSPERFVEAALQALPAEAFGSRLPQAAEIRRLADSGRSKGAAAVAGLFALWSSLDAAGARPVALLLDEATEIRSLAYFEGLRHVDRLFSSALATRPRGTILATSYPTLARKLWPFLETIEAPPLTAADLDPLLRGAGIRADAPALACASFGWPRHLGVLIRRLASGSDLAAAWAEEMAEGGRIELACRHTYESLLLRSRGYGMSKAVLAAVAAEEGLNLTSLVARLGRTPGAIRDYLGWLLGVDALKMVRKRYFYVDGMVRWWVRLHGRGTPPRPAELLSAAREATGQEPFPAPAPPAAADGAAASVFRRDSLMEID